MGRTNPTYRDYLQSVDDEWQPFRRALRQQNMADYDSLVDYARQYADAAGYLNRTDPEIALLLSMLVGLEAERRAVEARVADLEDAHADS
jgi:hypothetical protein